MHKPWSSTSTDYVQSHVRIVTPANGPTMNVTQGMLAHSDQPMPMETQYFDMTDPGVDDDQPQAYYDADDGTRRGENVVYRQPTSKATVTIAAGAGEAADSLPSPLTWYGSE